MTKSPCPRPRPASPTCQLHQRKCPLARTICILRFKRWLWNIWLGAIAKWHRSLRPVTLLRRARRTFGRKVGRYSGIMRAGISSRRCWVRKWIGLGSMVASVRAACKFRSLWLQRRHIVEHNLGFKPKMRHIYVKKDCSTAFGLFESRY